MKYFVFLSLYALLFPTFNSYVGTTGVIFVNGGIIVLISFYALMHIKQKVKFPSIIAKKTYVMYSLIFVIFGVHLCYSFVNGMILGNVEIIWRDIFELYRPVFMFLVFSFSFYTFIGQQQNFNTLCKVLIIIFICIIVMGGLQYVLRANSEILALYTKIHNLNSGRISVPFINPYDYAFVMSFFVFWFFITSVSISIKYLPVFFIALVFFFATQSRSVAAGLIIGLFFIIPFLLFIIGFSKNKKIISKAFIKTIILICSFIIIFIFSIATLLEFFPYMGYSIMKVIESGNIGNGASYRLEQFFFALDKAQNPLLFLFGNGPSKNEMEYVESMYTYQFYRYGLLGVILYFIYPLLLSCALLWKLIKKYKANTVEYCFYFALLVWFLCMPVMFIGNNLTEQVRTSYLYYMFLGVIASQYANIYVCQVNKK